MREILFKAKRLDNGAWVEGSLITYKDGTAFICCEDYIPDVLNKYEVDPSTVCQYTGLTDKNGKKIFDGDVVRRETDYYGKHTYGVYLLALDTHIVCVFDGRIVDTWNSGGKTVLYYWMED